MLRGDGFVLVLALLEDDVILDVTLGVGGERQRLACGTAVLAAHAQWVLRHEDFWKGTPATEIFIFTRYVAFTLPVGWNG